MKKADKAEFDSLFTQCVRPFPKRCFICRQPWTIEESYTIHHREYPENEKTYDDFRFPNGTKDKLSYYKYLTPIIASLTRKEANRRFRLIHDRHHYALENPRSGWANYKLENFERMVIVAREIIKRKISGKRYKASNT